MIFTISIIFSLAALAVFLFAPRDSPVRGFGWALWAVAVVLIIVGLVGS